MNWGIKGIWIAFTVVGILQDIGYWFIINYCDWKQIAAEMEQQLNAEKA